MSLSVPDRWLKYKPYGESIKDTKLLPLKVPLKEAISRYVQPEERFTPAMLLEAFPNLKYIIDLTSTYRYYDRNVFTEAGVRYEKVMIPGQKVPAFEHVERFFQVMDEFMSTSAEGDLIGIHCTHGVNRTGYLICRYLIQQLGWEVGRAIKEFDEARGHAIEREAYLSALKKASRGEKIDTSCMNLAPQSGFRGGRAALESGPPPVLAGKRVPFEMGPPPIRLLAPPRRMHEGRFPPQQFSFGRPRPGFGTMPSPPPPPPPPLPPPLPPGFRVLAGMPPILPPPPPPPPPLPAPSPTVLPSASPTSTSLAPRPGMFGPRGCWFMPRLRPPMSPPLPKRSFPPRKLPPGLPSVMDNPGNTGQVPIISLPLPPVLPPPRPPPLPKVPSYNSIRGTRRKADAISGNHSDQDFTADTFEENLLEGGPGDSSGKCKKRRLRRPPPNGPRIDTRRPRLSGMPMKRR